MPEPFALVTLDEAMSVSVVLNDKWRLKYENFDVAEKTSGIYFDTPVDLPEIDEVLI